jgi:hypothetical protein
VDVPRYREMMEFGARQLGFGLDEFRVFRWRLKYPPIPTLALLSHPLLPRARG